MEEEEEEEEEEGFRLVCLLSFPKWRRIEEEREEWKGEGWVVVGGSMYSTAEPTKHINIYL